MRSTFNILFYINRSKTKKNGKCPVMGRISVDGKLVQFSTKEDIETSCWSVEKGCSIGNDKASKELNKKLKDYHQKLQNHYNNLVLEEAYVTAESLKHALLSDHEEEGMFLKEFANHNVEYLKKVGVSKSKASYHNYVHAYKSLEKFINQKYDMQDIALRELQYTFIEDFEFFMRTSLKFSSNTIFNILLKLKYLIHRAIRDGLIRKNPFADFKCRQEKTDRKWLSKNNLDAILHTPMDNEKIERTRILFIFSIFTGLAYADLYNLKHKDVCVDNDGTIWIQINRQKTDTTAVIPMLEIAKQIYLKYKTQEVCQEDRVFDVPIYQTTLNHLKAIGEVVGIEGLSYHQSRHSFATTVCLSNGIPIETLSQMMGHKKISTTQIYGKITNQKVEKDMQALEKRLGNKYLHSQYNLLNNANYENRI